MRYAVSLFLGLVAGVALVLAGIYYNPLTRENTRVPLTAAPESSVEVFYSSRPEDTILRTRHEDRLLPLVPENMDDLWEPTLEGASAWLTVLRDVDDMPVGIGMKMSVLAKDSRALTGEVLMDSAWNLHLPGRGSLFVATEDNLWPLLREVLIPAWQDEGRRWQGSFSGDLTVGPEPTLVGRVTGGAGVYEDTQGEAREHLRLDAFSFTAGATQMKGSLLMTVRGKTETVSGATPE